MVDLYVVAVAFDQLDALLGRRDILYVQVIVILPIVGKYQRLC